MDRVYTLNEAPLFSNGRRMAREGRRREGVRGGNRRNGKINE
jgi:hypothetical protein